MRKKTHKQHRKSSPDALLKTSKKKDIELTEPELKISKELSDSELNKATGGKVSYGDMNFVKRIDKASPYVGLRTLVRNGGTNA